MLKAIKKDLMTLEGTYFGTYKAQPFKKESDTIRFLDYLINNAPEVNLFGCRFNYDNYIFNDWKADEINETDSGNSYNWTGPVIFQYRFFTYRDREYTAICFHRFGDVRGNYTKYAVLDCNKDEFWELLLDFRISIPSDSAWSIDQSLLSETGTVDAWNSETDESFNGYYESDEAPAEVKAAVESWLGY